MKPTYHDPGAVQVAQRLLRRGSHGVEVLYLVPLLQAKVEVFGRKASAASDGARCRNEPVQVDGQGLLSAEEDMVVVAVANAVMVLWGNGKEQKGDI